MHHIKVVKIFLPQEQPADASTSWEQRAWDLVSTECSIAPVWVFHVLMQRSAVPPPLASRFAWKGHHASACAPVSTCQNAVKIVSAASSV